MTFALFGPAFRGMGHKDVKAAMVYTHVLNRGGKGVKSPVNSLWPIQKEGRQAYGKLT